MAKYVVYNEDAMLSSWENNSSILTAMRCCSCKGGSGIAYPFNFSKVMVATVVPFEFLYICSCKKGDANHIVKNVGFQ